MSTEKNALKSFWKPDGKRISSANEARLRDWMRENGLSTRPGAITVLIHSAVHQSTRGHALKKLKIGKK